MDKAKNRAIRGVANMLGVDIAEVMGVDPYFFDCYDTGFRKGERAGYYAGLVHAQSLFLDNDGDEAAILIGKRLEQILKEV